MSDAGESSNPELDALIAAREADALTPAGLARLEHLVLTDPAARRAYVLHEIETASLRWWAGGAATKMIHPIEDPHFWSQIPTSAAAWDAQRQQNTASSDEAAEEPRLDWDDRSVDLAPSELESGMVMPAIREVPDDREELLLIPGPSFAQAQEEAARRPGRVSRFLAVASTRRAAIILLVLGAALVLWGDSVRSAQRVAGQHTRCRMGDAARRAAGGRALAGRHAVPEIRLGADPVYQRRLGHSGRAGAISRQRARHGRARPGEADGDGAGERPRLHASHAVGERGGPGHRIRRAGRDARPDAGRSLPGHGDGAAALEDGKSSAPAKTLTDGSAISIAAGSNEITPVAVSPQTGPDAFVRDLASVRRPLPLHGTGVGLAVGAADPNWRIVGVSADPAFQPRPAVVTSAASTYMPGNSEHGQWISLTADTARQPLGTYTFAATVDLTGFDPRTAIIAARIAFDDGLADLRVNGLSASAPIPLDRAKVFNFARTQAFTLDRGFRPGLNFIEFVVSNSGEAPSPMALRVEWEGTAAPLGDADDLRR